MFLRILDGFLHAMSNMWFWIFFWRFFRRESIHYVNGEDHVKYKYIELSFGLNHDEELQVNASILGATSCGEYSLVHPGVQKNMFYLGLGLDSLDG